MTTWTSNSLVALGILAMLSACDAALPPVPLTQAMMMQGNVALMPPRGYCIDPESLTQNFALMARCDALGAPEGGSGAPIGVLTVSFARDREAGAPVPTADEIAAATGLGAPLSTRSHAGSVIFKTSGTPPAADLSPLHWRSVSRVGGYTMGAALFSPADRRAVSEEGAEFLTEMIRRTTEKTNAR